MTIDSTKIVNLNIKKEERILDFSDFQKQNIKFDIDKLQEAYNQIVNIKKFDVKPLENKRVLLKGCTDTYIPEDSYVQLSNKLMGNVKSLMFGEACSNVPIFKS